MLFIFLPTVDRCPPTHLPPPLHSPWLLLLLLVSALIRFASFSHDEAKNLSSFLVLEISCTLLRLSSSSSSSPSTTTMTWLQRRSLPPGYEWVGGMPILFLLTAQPNGPRLLARTNVLRTISALFVYSTTKLLIPYINSTTTNPLPPPARRRLMRNVLVLKREGGKLLFSLPPSCTRLFASKSLKKLGM